MTTNELIAYIFLGILLFTGIVFLVLVATFTFLRSDLQTRIIDRYFGGRK